MQGRISVTTDCWPNEVSVEVYKYNEWRAIFYKESRWTKYDCTYIEGSTPFVVGNRYSYSDIMKHCEELRWACCD